jgi:predicted metal-binding membrane protein
MMSWTTTATMVTMMVAMMLPSIGPTLWGYYRRLHAARMPRAGRHVVFFAVGYVSVWTVISLILVTLSVVLPPFAPLTLGVVVLGLGIVQQSRWKAKQLLRCRDTCVTAPTKIVAACWMGCRLGVSCSLSCAAPMAVLFATGLMDVPMMVMITGAITIERVAPGGARTARATGALAVAAGLIICLRALGVALTHGA